MSTTRTSSPYFSPNSAIAPEPRASSWVVTKARTSTSSEQDRVDLVLDVGQHASARPGPAW